MKIKITLTLIAVSLTAFSPSIVASMPSPEEQQQAMRQMNQFLDENPQITQAIRRDMSKAAEQGLTQLSPKELEEVVRTIAYEAYGIHLKHKNDASFQASVINKLLQLDAKTQRKVLAEAVAHQELRKVGERFLAMNYLAQYGTDIPVEDDESSPASDQEPKPQELSIPQDHVIILPVKKAEAFAKDLEQRLRATKGFAQSYAMLLANLDMNAWNKVSEEEEKWLKSLQEQIEKAKKKPTETAVLGGVSADFEAALAQDCQSGGLVPLITAMELHVMKSDGQLTQGAPSIESLFEKLPTSEQEKERLEKLRKSAVGKVALVRAFIPKKINELLPVSEFSKSPLLEHAKLILAARKSAAKPTAAT